jgi:hypothetical protein
MITIVSGIPRSGTSLMMQMLSAGGMAVFSDGRRGADANNPRGYYELESVKALARDARVISEGEGKAVKVISSLLEYLPSGHDYRIIFMRRALAEVVASQDRMLERLGKAATTSVSAESIIRAFEKHLKEVESWLERQPNMAVIYVEYSAVLREPYAEASRIADFLEQRLDLEAMVGKVEVSLHRERMGSPPVAPR